MGGESHGTAKQCFLKDHSVFLDIPQLIQITVESSKKYEHMFDCTEATRPFGAWSDLYVLCMYYATQTIQRTFVDTMKQGTAHSILSKKLHATNSLP